MQGNPDSGGWNRGPIGPNRGKRAIEDNFEFPDETDHEIEKVISEAVERLAKGKF